jgi:hypothetical protein
MGVKKLNELTTDFNDLSPFQRALRSMFKRPKGNVHLAIVKNKELIDELVGEEQTQQEEQENAPKKK